MFAQKIKLAFRHICYFAFICLSFIHLPFYTFARIYYLKDTNHLPKIESIISSDILKLHLLILIKLLSPQRPYKTHGDQVKAQL